MPKVFISYSRSDAEFVEKLVDDLGSLGFDVLLDTKHLRGGRSTVREIHQKIEQSDYLIPIITPESVRSEWVEPVEIRWAFELEKRERRQIRILPIMLKQGRSKFESLAGLNYIDFTGEYSLALAKLVQALPDPEYDEVYNLRKELDEERIGNRSLLRILRRVARNSRESGRSAWAGLPVPMFMKRIRSIEKDEELLNEAYWWLIVHGVLRFRDIEMFWEEDDNYKDSMKYAKIAPRGAMLMEDLSAERVEPLEADKLRPRSGPPLRKKRP